MRIKKILKEDKAAPTGLELANLIMKNYIVYPVDKNSAWIPFNYCMIPKVAPEIIKAPLKSMFSLICN